MRIIIHRSGVHRGQREAIHSVDRWWPARSRPFRPRRPPSRLRALAISGIGRVVAPIRKSPRRVRCRGAGQGWRTRLLFCCRERLDSSANTGTELSGRRWLRWRGEGLSGQVAASWRHGPPKPNNGCGLKAETKAKCQRPTKGDAQCPPSLPVHLRSQPRTAEQPPRAQNNRWR